MNCQDYGFTTPIQCMDELGHWGKTASGLANIDTGKALIFKEHVQEWKDRENGLS